MGSYNVIKTAAIGVASGIAGISPAADANVPLDEIGYVRVAQNSALTHSIIPVWIEGDEVVLREHTATMRRHRTEGHWQRLYDLLSELPATAESPAQVPYKVILVGGGGDGFHWTKPKPAPAEPPAGQDPE
jgi:hypothetical protein